MNNQQINKSTKVTKPIRIDANLHQLIKLKATRQNMTMRSLLEEYLTEVLAVEQEDKK